MILRNNGKGNRGLVFLCLGLLLLLAGCAGTDMGNLTGGDESGMEPENLPYSAVDFADVRIPAELEWDRENSMSVTTESFAGGTLKFDGRVEVNSLVDFFVNSMANNQWKMVGSVKYENILLAFTKPYKTCTICIFESEFSGNTTVYIYITDDIASRTGGGSVDVNPFK